MNWLTDFAGDGSLLTITVLGQATVAGFAKFLIEAVEHPSWRSGIPVLLDFRTLELAHLTSAQVIQIALEQRPHADKIAASPIAVLVSRTVDFGVVRMWQAHSSDMNLTHEAFYSVEEAKGWLRESVTPHKGVSLFHPSRSKGH